MTESTRALDSFAKALAILEHTSAELDKTSAHLNRGVIYYKIADWQKAGEAFELANSAYLQLSGNHYLQAYVYNNLGHVRQKQGRLREAAALLEQSIQLWQMAGDELMRGNTLGALAGVMVDQGREREAMPLYEEAIAILAGFPDNAWGQEQLRTNEDALAHLQKKRERG